MAKRSRGGLQVNPVKIVETVKPLPVIMEEPESRKPIEKKGMVLPPNTTEQDDIISAGQRRINLIWELTQAFIAIVVISSNMVVGVLFALRGTDDTNYPLVLSSSLFLIVGFYFSRTNHTAIGGVGRRAPQRFEGR